jgi:hypothetical protein
MVPAGALMDMSLAHSRISVSIFVGMDVAFRIHAMMAII